MRRTLRHLSLAFLLLWAVCVVACYQVLGLGNFTDECPQVELGENCPDAGPDGSTTTGGTGGASASTSSSMGSGSTTGTGGHGGASSTSSGTTTSTSSGTATGTSSGTGGTGGGSSCMPGSAKPCYTGPLSTLNIGACVAGMETCDADGNGYGACVGEVTPQPATCKSALDVACNGLNCDIWQTMFGGVSGAEANGVAIDSAGNVIVVGDFSGTVAFGNQTLHAAGGMTALVVKYDPMGTPLWSDQFGVSGGAYASSVAVDASGDVIVAGSFGGQIAFTTPNNMTTTFSAPAKGSESFVVELDGMGNVQWANALPNVAYSIAIAVDPRPLNAGGGTVVATGPTDVGNVTSVLLQTYSPAGALGFSKVFGSAAPPDGGVANAEGLAVAVDATGNIVLGGSFDATLSFGGSSTPLPTPNAGDVGAAFLAKFDSSGTATWSRSFASNALGGSGVRSMATAPSGEIAIGGIFVGAVDLGAGSMTSTTYNAFVGFFDPSGTPLWSKSFSDTLPQYGTGVAVDASKNVVLTGSTQGTTDFGGGPLTSAGATDLFVAKFDVTGTYQWARLYGDGAAQQGNAIAATPTGETVVVGTAAGAINFGAGALTAADAPDGGSAADAVVAKLAP